MARNNVYVLEFTSPRYRNCRLKFYPSGPALPEEEFIEVPFPDDAVEVVSPLGSAFKQLHFGLAEAPTAQLKIFMHMLDGDLCSYINVPEYSILGTLSTYNRWVIQSDSGRDEFDYIDRFEGYQKKTIENTDTVSTGRSVKEIDIYDWKRICLETTTLDQTARHLCEFSFKDEFGMADPIPYDDYITFARREAIDMFAEYGENHYLKTFRTKNSVTGKYFSAHFFLVSDLFRAIGMMALRWHYFFSRQGHLLDDLRPTVENIEDSITSLSPFWVWTWYQQNYLSDQLPGASMSHTRLAFIAFFNKNENPENDAPTVEQFDSGQLVGGLLLDKTIKEKYGNCWDFLYDIYHSTCAKVPIGVKEIKPARIFDHIKSAFQLKAEYIEGEFQLSNNYSVLAKCEANEINATSSDVTRYQKRVGPASDAEQNWPLPAFLLHNCPSAQPTEGTQIDYPDFFGYNVVSRSYSPFPIGTLYYIDLLPFLDEGGVIDVYAIRVHDYCVLNLSESEDSTPYFTRPDANLGISIVSLSGIGNLVMEKSWSQYALQIQAASCMPTVAVNTIAGVFSNGKQAMADLQIKSSSGVSEEMIFSELGRAILFDLKEIVPGSMYEHYGTTAFLLSSESSFASDAQKIKIFIRG